MTVTQKNTRGKKLELEACVTPFRSVISGSGVARDTPRRATRGSGRESDITTDICSIPCILSWSHHVPSFCSTRLSPTSCRSIPALAIFLIRKTASIWSPREDSSQRLFSSPLNHTDTRLSQEEESFNTRSTQPFPPFPRSALFSCQWRVL